MNKTAFSLILMAGLLLAALPAKLGGRGFRFWYQALIIWN